MWWSSTSVFTLQRALLSAHQLRKKKKNTNHFSVYIFSSLPVRSLPGIFHICARHFSWIAKYVRNANDSDTIIGPIFTKMANGKRTNNRIERRGKITVCRHRQSRHSKDDDDDGIHFFDSEFYVVLKYHNSRSFPYRNALNNLQMKISKLF